MSILLTWAGEYSASVVILFVCGAALIFVFRHIVEKVVEAEEAEFDKRNKHLELCLERRSGFEEKILIDQYEAVTTLQLKLGKISADLNRIHSGKNIEGFREDKKIVPLTEVYIELQAKRFLLKEEFSILFQKEADILFKAANTENTDEFFRLGRDFLILNEEFKKQMNHVFGIEQISWAELRTIKR